jgi:hypothetical protein
MSSNEIAVFVKYVSTVAPVVTLPLSLSPTTATVSTLKQAAMQMALELDTTVPLLEHMCIVHHGRVLRDSDSLPPPLSDGSLSLTMLKVLPPKKEAQPVATNPQQQRSFPSIPQGSLFPAGVDRAFLERALQNPQVLQQVK